MTPANPFHYGTPVRGEQFAGRERELDALVSRMRNGVNVVLLSPRRYGKTSLLLEAEAQLAQDDPPAGVVKANVLRCRDLSTLVARAPRRIDGDAVGRGLDQAVAHEAATYAEMFASRPPGQRRVLVALATGSAYPVFSAAFARSVGLAGSNSVKKAIDALAADEVVTNRDGRPVVADPFFAAWLRPAAGLEPAS